MIRTAICDDNEQAVLLHHGIAEKSFRACGIGSEIFDYTESDNLMYDVEEDHFHFDLLLLDIEMPKLTGMELAKKVKRQLPNIKIIFITSHLEYTVDAFELSVFRYVPKNEIETRLAAAITDAAKMIELEAGQEYIIRTNSRMERIAYKDIYYMERDGKNVSIFTTMGVSKVRKSLQQVYDELNAPEFIFIDRGRIVNLIQIIKIHDGMAVLKNGDLLPVSRSHLQGVKQQINRFWGSHI